MTNQIDFRVADKKRSFKVQGGRIVQEPNEFELKYTSRSGAIIGELTLTIKLDHLIDEFGRDRFDAVLYVFKLANEGAEFYEATSDAQIKISNREKIALSSIKHFLLDPKLESRLAYALFERRENDKERWVIKMLFELEKELRLLDGEIGDHQNARRELLKEALLEKSVLSTKV